jgi:hypothetical protein
MGGHTLIPLLRSIYKHPMATKGDDARKHADLVAMAASLQLITTRLSATEYGRQWRVTTKGLAWLNEKDT